MSKYAKNAFGFFLGCLGVAVVAFAIFAGIAFWAAQGQATACAHSGGHWYATDTTTHNGNGDVDRVRECKR